MGLWMKAWRVVNLALVWPIEIGSSDPFRIGWGSVEEFDLGLEAGLSPFWTIKEIIDRVAAAIDESNVQIRLRDHCLLAGCALLADRYLPR